MRILPDNKGAGPLGLPDQLDLSSGKAVDAPNVVSDRRREQRERIWNRDISSFCAGVTRRYSWHKQKGGGLSCNFYSLARMKRFYQSISHHPV
jgi:hypothetical protein